MKSLHKLALCLLVATGVACSDSAPAPTGPVRQAVDSGILIPALRSSVDASGRFILPGAGPDEISETTAREYAEVYLRHFLPQIIDDWVTDRKAAIGHRTLKVCEHAFYAASPYEPLDDNAELMVRMLFSSRWLVGACSPDGTQVGSIGIASRATHLVLRDGRFTAGDQSGVFISSGVPMNTRSVLVTPEGAVAAVVGRVGKLAAAVPELVLHDPFDRAPQHAKWKIALEAPVTLELDHTDASVTTSTLYHGHDSSLTSEKMLVEQPLAREGKVLRYFGLDGQAREITLTIRTGYATGYSAVRQGGR